MSRVASHFIVLIDEDKSWYHASCLIAWDNLQLYAGTISIMGPKERDSGLITLSAH